MDSVLFHRNRRRISLLHFDNSSHCSSLYVSLKHNVLKVFSRSASKITAWAKGLAMTGPASWMQFENQILRMYNFSIIQLA